MDDSESDTFSISSGVSDTELQEDQEVLTTSTPLWIAKSRKERQKIIFEPEPYEPEDIFFSTNTT